MTYSFWRSTSRGSLVLLAISVGAALTDPAQAAPTSDPFAQEPDAPNGIVVTSPAGPRPAKPAAPPPIGNPLWAVPLSALSATQERPLFAPSRRPPPRAVVAAPAASAPPPQAPEMPPAPLQLSLIGAVVGDGDAIAVFLDRVTQSIVRLRAGQSHAGWSLTSILPREATLTRGDRAETLVIRRSEPAAASEPPPMGTSYAPFMPRSTPKNGASDGL